MTKLNTPIRAAAIAVAITTTAALIPSAAANASDTSRATQRTYLALGDSVPLGFMPKFEDPWAIDRMVGYPELIGGFTGVDITNLSCPGQTAQAIGNLDAPDAGCFEYRAQAEAEGVQLLHADYDGTQLDAALDIISTSGAPVLISIQGGGNEVAMCAGDHPEPERCLRETLSKITRSLRDVATRLAAAAPLARIVLVGYHPVPGLEDGLRKVNQAIMRAARLAHVGFVDVAALFELTAAPHRGDLCKAGLLSRLPDGSCDLHPSAKGQRLYAAAVLSAAVVGR